LEQREYIGAHLVSSGISEGTVRWRGRGKKHARTIFKSYCDNLDLDVSREEITSEELPFQSLARQQTG